MNATELFERQAAWQLARKDRSWEEKLNQSLRMRDAFQKLRNSKPIPPQQATATNISSPLESQNLSNEHVK